jgi:integrase
LGPHYYQETIRLLWCVQETLEKKFVLSLPNARFRAFEYAVDHLRGTVRVESATSVEPGIADDLGPLAYSSRDVDAGRVVVHASCKAPRVIRVLGLELAIGVRRVKGVKRLGTRIGNWLSREQAQDLLDAIPRSTLAGKRDAAIIALLLGCGLRRSEVVSLRLDQFQSREGHWVIVDLRGKGGRVRTVPVPCWCKALIDILLRDSRVTDGKVFRRIWKNKTELGFGVATDVVWCAVKRYAKQIGIDHLAPHDLRRTCARLCHSSGGELEQIQFLLGHASVQTTERYIGCRQKFKDAVNDRFEMSLASRP